MLRYTRKIFTKPVQCVQQQSRALSQTQTQKTKLYDYHVSNGGKMVDFAGWQMPVQYKDMGIIESTMHTRENASIFDVSHMGQLKLFGEDRVEFLESLVVGSVKPLKEGQAKYSLLTNARGGIIDDLVILNRSDQNYHHVVVNASRVDVDLAHLKSHLAKDVSIEVMDASLVAFQGPKAVEILSKHCDFDFNTLKFFYARDLSIDGIQCQVSRTGYTGEDGFEISVSNEQVQTLVELLMQDERVKLAGLGARDALRLEAGLCLYGNDLDESTTPVEANLLWTMSKKRRASGEFTGYEIIREQIENGVSRTRVGFMGEKGLTPRGHMKILTAEGEEIGEVTSGAFSPCLSKPIGMGYVRPEYASPETPLKVEIRAKKQIDVTVCALPFVPTSYFTAP